MAQRAQPVSRCPPAASTVRDPGLGFGVSSEMANGANEPGVDRKPLGGGRVLDPGLHLLGQAQRHAGDLAAIGLGPGCGFCRRRYGLTLGDVD